MILFRVDVPIFNLSVVFAGDCKAEEADDAFYDFRDRNDKSVRVVTGFADAPREATASVTSAKGDVYCWVGNTDHCSTIFHEMVHVAFSICQTRGIELDEELIAYLVGWLEIEVVEKIQDFRDAREKGDQIDSDRD